MIKCHSVLKRKKHRKITTWWGVTRVSLMDILGQVSQSGAETTAVSVFGEKGCF